MEAIHETIEWVALGIELLAVAVIVAAVLMLAIRRGTVRYLLHLEQAGAYDNYTRQLGRPLMLALDLLVAADIVRTVTLDATMNSVAVLGLFVLVRTFLSWALKVEIDGRWPWQRAPEAST